MAISVILGIPLGIFAAVRVNTWLDSFSNVFANLGLAMPSFWLGIMLMLIFAVNLQWLPVQGSGTFKHIIMPAVALGLVFTAANMRLARSAMLEVLGSEYIKLARIKGLTESLVILKHAFKNAIIPVLTFACINFALIIRVQSSWNRSSPGPVLAGSSLKESRPEISPWSRPRSS